MTSLKTHLLYLALDMAKKRADRKEALMTRELFQRYNSQFWKFIEPKDICDLAISSPHGYRIVAYVMKRLVFIVGIYGSSLKCYTSQKSTTTIASFSNEYHIGPMIQIAAQYCRKIQGHTFHDVPYMSAFLSGLAYNNHCYFFMPCEPKELTIYLSDVNDRAAVEKLTKKLKSIASKSWKTVDRDGVYRFLLVNDFHWPVAKEDFSFLKDLKVESLFIWPNYHTARQTLTFDFFREYRPNMEYLKRFRCDYKVNVTTARLMLKHYRIPEVTFHHVVIPDRNVELVKKIPVLRKAMNDFWQTVINYRGKVYAYCTSVQLVNDTWICSWELLVAKVRSSLPEFTFNETDNDITCTLEKVHDTKKVVFKVVFFNYLHYLSISKRERSLYTGKLHYNEVMLKLSYAGDGC